MTVEERIQHIVTLMYDTGVPLDVLEREVCPYLAPNVTFLDPALRSRGFDKIRTGMRGFHCAFKFELVIHQISVQHDTARGRALVDATMNLRSIPGYCYPLRTILVYEFALDHGNEPLIDRIEEMWPLGDLLANAPLGALYGRVFRAISGVGFLGFFWLATKLRGGKVRPSP